MEKSDVIAELAIEYEVQEIPTDEAEGYTLTFSSGFDSEGGDSWQEWDFDVMVTYSKQSDRIAVTAAMPDGAANNLGFISEGTVISKRDGQTLLSRSIDKVSAKSSIMDDVYKLIDDAIEFISPE